MALVPDLVRQSIVSPGTSTTWVDETVYGGANPLRNQVAVYFTSYKMDENQVASAMTVTTFDPKTATEFVATSTVDGWYRSYFVIVNDWLVGTVYNRYDLVWSPTLNAFYQYINASPTSGNLVTNPVYFSLVVDPTSVLNVGTALEPQNIVYQVIDKVVSYATSVCYLKAAAKHAKESCSGASCGCDSKIGRLFHRIRDLFANLALNEAQGLYVQGEKNARLAEKWCDDCGCLTE